MKERDSSFDILKGLLIFTVVWGHSISNSGLEDFWHNYLFNAIYLFHMPLFVFVSGYFCHSIINKDFKTILYNKTKRLIIPYLSYTIIGLIIYLSTDFRDLGISSSEDITQLTKDLLYIITGNWYLPCIFVLTLVYFPIINGLGQKKYIILGVLFLLAWVISLLFSSYYPFVLLERLQISRQAVVFGLGLLYYYIKDRLNKPLKTIIILLSICGAISNFIISGYWFCEYNIYQKIVNGIFCTIISFAILYSISSILKDIVLGKVIAFVGQNTLGIYLIHGFFCPPLHRLLSPVVGSGYWGILLAAIFNIIISLIACKIIKDIFKQHSYILGA